MERLLRGDATRCIAAIPRPLLWAAIAGIVLLGAGLLWLARRSERYRLLAESCSDVIWLCALPGMHVTYVSPSVEQRRGWSPEDYVGQQLADIPGDGERQVRRAVTNQLERLAAGDASARSSVVEVELSRRDDRQVPVEIATTILCDEQGRPRYLLGVSRDITHRKATDEAIRQLAYQDPLTHLPNRRLLEDRLVQAIACAQRERLIVALLFVDLDGFKRVNDELGHAAGDWALQRIAEQLRASIRASDTVARVGGDEFVVLLPEVRAERDARLVAEKIRAAMEQPLVTPDGATLFVSCSIGIALYPVDAPDARTLARSADDAMYRAKRAGKNAVWVARHAAPAQPSPALKGGERS